MKRQSVWIGMLVLLWLAVNAAGLLGWPVNDGFTGLVIRFFLGYCAIILVAQVFSALAAIRDVLDELTRKKKTGSRVVLR